MCPQKPNKEARGLQPCTESRAQASKHCPPSLLDLGPLYQFHRSQPTAEQLPCLQNICALLGQTSFLLLTVGRIYTVGESLQRSVRTQPSWASDKVPRLLHQQQSLDLRVWELNEFLKRNQEYRKHQSH